ncbi:hypothetical protein GCM10010428_45830 [Actinosynnema pretiosum subsp. pretiosum]
MAGSVAGSGDYARVRQLAAQRGQDEHASIVARAAVAAATQGYLEIAVELLAESERIPATTCDAALQDRVMVDAAQALAPIGACDHAHTVASSITGSLYQVWAFPALCVDPDADRHTRAVGRLFRFAS